MGGTIIVILFITTIIVFGVVAYSTTSKIFEAVQNRSDKITDLKVELLELHERIEILEETLENNKKS